MELVVFVELGVAVVVLVVVVDAEFVLPVFFLDRVIVVTLK